MSIFNDAPSIVLLCTLIGIIVWRLYVHSKRPKLVKAEYNNEIMTIEYNNGEVVKYKGGCTVWHKLPYMKRCSTGTEEWLCDIWTYIREYGNAYPTSHLNKEYENTEKGG